MMMTMLTSTSEMAAAPPMHPTMIHTTTAHPDLPITKVPTPKKRGKFPPLSFSPSKL